MKRYVLLLLMGCATAKPSTNVQMEPLHIRATPDPLTGLEAYDADDLLDKGNDLFDKENFEGAIVVYQRVIESFPTSSVVPRALYNIGLTYERQEKWALALDSYKRIIAEFAPTSVAKDATYRLAFCYSKLNQWKDVEQTFWATKQRTDLSPMDELEARVGLAIAFFMQGDHATAERDLLEALRFYEDRQEKEYLPAGYWVAQARFYLGEIAARSFEAIEFKSSETDHDAWTDDMKKKLEDKCEFLLRAQNYFIRTIRDGHTGWATAAGYRIGSLYERMYDELLKAEPPPGFDDEARALYLKELRGRVAVLLKKAITVYERSLDMAKRVGEANDWVEQTQKALDRMKALALESLENS